MEAALGSITDVEQRRESAGGRGRPSQPPSAERFQLLPPTLTPDAQITNEQHLRYLWLHGEMLFAVEAFWEYAQIIPPE